MNDEQPDDSAIKLEYCEECNSQHDRRYLHCKAPKRESETGMKPMFSYLGATQPVAPMGKNRIGMVMTKEPSAGERIAELWIGSSERPEILIDLIDDALSAERERAKGLVEALKSAKLQFEFLHNAKDVGTLVGFDKCAGDIATALADYEQKETHHGE